MVDNVIGKRLELFIKQLKISQNEFAKSVGLSSGLISYITTGKTNFGVDKLAKIKEEYPDINLEWLVSGYGSMLKSKKEIEKDMVELLSKKGIEIYDIDNPKNSPESYLYLPFKELNISELKCYKIKNDELAPFLFDGDYVLAEKNRNWKYNLFENQLCVFTTSEDYSIGRVVNVETILKNGKVHLQKNSGNTKIDVENVSSVWIVKSKISYNVNTNSNQLKIGGKSNQLVKSEQRNGTGPFMANLFSTDNNNKPVVFYFGAMSHEIKSTLLKDLKNFIMNERLAPLKAKKLFAQSADCLEVKQLSGTSNFRPSTFFSIQKTNSEYKIIMGKMLPKSVTKKIENNNPIKENLKLFQKMIYEKENISTEDEILLGLLKLISKNKTNVLHEFVYYDKEYNLFFIKITI